MIFNNYYQTQLDIYEFLKSSSPGVLGSKAIKWNFTKFLIDSSGNVVERYAPQTSINEIRRDLMPLLISSD